VPDFIPVIGYADDAVLVVWTLRSVARLAGAEAIAKHWPGTSEGLQTVVRFAGLNARQVSQTPRPLRGGCGHPDVAVSGRSATTVKALAVVGRQR